ncbi:FecR family protein [Gaoshiqia sp. Z1-71]|uniref:FecR family protein n=1 Tax=Gaoshiqia hydrogeniformans TaxID=3290090 RepID=UPI003BF8230F
MDEQKKLGEQLIDHFSSTDGAEGKHSPELDKWIQSSSENKKIFLDMLRIWQNTKRLSKMRAFDPQRAWQQVDGKIGRQQRKRQQVYRLAYTLSGMAATLLIVIGLQLHFSVFSDNPVSLAASTTYGSRTEITLPDGTAVHLNAGSSISYQRNASNRDRQVSFSGEGFFDVAKSNHPFVITTGDGMKLKVLGTKFNLQAYPGDAIIQTALIEGKVELQVEGGHTLTLLSGQTANFEKNGKTLSLVQGPMAQVLSWLENKLYMDHMSLGEVCKRLERQYDVRIEIEDQILAGSIHYSGVLSEETISDVLDALCALSEIHYTMKGKNIFITKK